MPTDTTKRPTAGKVSPQGAAAPAVAALSRKNTKTRIFATPLARQIAGERKIDLGQITGTGPHGRIVKADLDIFHEQKPPSTISARLNEAEQAIPYFNLHRDIRLDTLLNIRTEINTQLVSRGIKLSINDFIIKACALALQAVPKASVIRDGEQVLHLKSSDIVVAIPVRGNGFITPVLRDADSKSLTTISTEIKNLSLRARNHKSTPQEYQSSRFTIFNPGLFEGKNFDTPVNTPHGINLTIGTDIKKPVVNDKGATKIATIIPVTLSVDQRLIDKTLAAQLLQEIIVFIEHPLIMLVS